MESHFIRGRNNPRIEKKQNIKNKNNRLMRNVVDCLNYFIVSATKHNRWQFYKIACILLSLLLVTGCVREDPDGIDPSEVVEKDIIIRVAVPYVAPKPQSRAIGDPEENTIKTIDVLAFRVGDDNKEYYDYYSEGVSTGSTNTSTQSFNVTVKLRDYQQRFVVITNAATTVATLVGSITPGGEKEIILSKLEFALNAAGDKWKTNTPSDYTAFPMWGESERENITITTSQLNKNVLLLRMIAKIDIQLDKTISGLTSKFKLKSVRLYNTNTKGRIVPDKAAITEEIRGGVPYWLVTSPTIPADIVPENKRYKGPLTYTDFSAPGEIDVAMRGAIYTFETAAVASTDMLKATCLVVGGIYENDVAETYYRLDFLENDKVTFRHVLRNYQYTANIVDVKGRGHGTPEEAFESKSSNMLVEILEWNDGGMGDIAFDGQFALSVSQSEFNFPRDEKMAEDVDNVLYILTDYTTTASEGVSGWYIEKIVDATDENTLVNWLTVTPMSGSAYVKTKVILTFGENTGTTPRSAFIIIAAGRLRYKVKVTQGITKAFGIRITDPATGLPISELKFTNTSPPMQPYKVTWAPIASDLAVTNTPITTEAFPSGGITGTPPVGNSTLSGGIKDYNIIPTPFTATELTNNPFMEKISRIDYLLSDGVSYDTKSIILHQINYDLLTNEASLYALDGQTHSFTFSTNAEWEATFGGVNTEIITTGTALRSGGPGMDQVFSFGLINGGTTDLSIKTFTVTFHSPTGQFPDKVVTIKAQVLYLRLNPTSYAVPGYNAMSYSFNIETSIPLNQLTSSIPNSANGIIQSATVNTSTGKLDVVLGVAQPSARTGSVRVTYNGVLTLTATATISRIANPYENFGGTWWTSTIYVETYRSPHNGSMLAPQCPTGTAYYFNYPIDKRTLTEAEQIVWAGGTGRLVGYVPSTYGHIQAWKVPYTNYNHYNYEEEYVYPTPLYMTIYYRCYYKP
jgi:hypothetical protein